MKLKKHSKILIGIVVAVLLLTGITAGYLQSYYHTDTQAVSALSLIHIWSKGIHAGHDGYHFKSGTE